MKDLEVLTIRRRTVLPLHPYSSLYVFILLRKGLSKCMIMRRLSKYGILLGKLTSLLKTKDLRAPTSQGCRDQAVLNIEKT